MIFIQTIYDIYVYDYAYKFKIFVNKLLKYVDGDVIYLF